MGDLGVGSVSEAVSQQDPGSAGQVDQRQAGCFPRPLHVGAYDPVDVLTGATCSHSILTLGHNRIEVVVWHGKSLRHLGFAGTRI